VDRAHFQQCSKAYIPIIQLACKRVEATLGTNGWDFNYNERLTFNRLVSFIYGVHLFLAEYPSFFSQFESQLIGDYLQNLIDFDPSKPDTSKFNMKIELDLAMKLAKYLAIVDPNK
jgi:hypothetical protein